MSPRKCFIWNSSLNRSPFRCFIWKLGSVLMLALLVGGCSQANTDPPQDSPFARLDLASASDLGVPSDLAKPARDLSADPDQGRSTGPLLVNEVYPHGADVNTDPDFIELYNAGSGQINLRGYKVRDDGAAWSTLPDDAVIAAGGFLVINCDELLSGGQPGPHVAFKLGASGDEVHLASPDGTELDSVAWGTGIVEIPKGQSLGRSPDFSGRFVVQSKPSRGKPNQ